MSKNEAADSYPHQPAPNVHEGFIVAIPIFVQLVNQEAGGKDNAKWHIAAEKDCGEDTNGNM